MPKRMVTYVRAFRQGKQVVEMESQEHLPPPAPGQTTIIFRPQVSAVPPLPATPSAETAARTHIAAGLYRQYCLTCHGVDGRGAEIRVAMPVIPDFTSRAWQRGQSNAQLAMAVLEGKGTLMPSFRGRVGEAKELVAYVRAFGGVGTPGTRMVETPPSDFETQYRQLQQQWDELEKQIQALSPPRRNP